MIPTKKLYQVLLKRMIKLDEYMIQAEKDKDNYHVLQYENKIVELERIMSLLREERKIEDFIK